MTEGTTTALLARVRTRLEGDPTPEASYLQELLTTIIDRICLRVGEATLPDILGSIAVDATVKLYRRQYYDGIASEGDDGLSVSFVEDILAEYDSELAKYRAAFATAEDGQAKGLVRFI